MIKLYFEGNELDTFQDENIELETRLKDVRDVSKIFDDFAQEFSVPASGKNNRTFRMFTNNAIVANPKSPTDLRTSKRAAIEMDGVIYKRGYMRYLRGAYKRGKLDHHVLMYTGSIQALSELFGDKTLADLNFNHLNHSIDAENVRLGMNYDTALFGNKVIYPLYSSTSNLVSIEAGTIDPTAFNPAVQVLEVFSAITEAFNDKPIFDFSQFDISKLYLWCGREVEEDQTTRHENILVYYSIIVEPGYDYGTSINTRSLFINQLYLLDQVDFYFTCADIPAGVDWTLRMYVGTTPSTSLDNWVYLPNLDVSGTGPVADALMTYPVFNLGPGSYFRPTLEIGEDAIVSYTMRVNTTTKQGVSSDIFNTVTNGVSVQRFDGSVIANKIPTMKIIDFVIGIAKIHNLVPELDLTARDTYVMKPYDLWKSEAKVWDITKNVDIDNHIVTVPEIPKSVSFKYSEPKAFINAQYYEEHDGKAYGDYELTNTGATGEAIEVKVGFENMAYIGFGSPSTSYIFGWAFTPKEMTRDYANVEVSAPILDSAFLMIWDDETNYNTNIDIAGFSAPITRNKIVYSSNFSTDADNVKTLMFNDHWYVFGKGTPEGTYLKGNYNLRYKNYLNQLLESTARLHSYTGTLDVATLSQITAATFLKINGTTFNINSFSIDSLDRKFKLDAITYFREFTGDDTPPDITPPIIGVLSVIPNDAPSKPTGLYAYNVLDTSFILAWESSTSASTSIVRYEIFRNAINVYSVVGSPPDTAIAIAGLPVGSSDNWTVRAEDEEGNFSSFSDQLFVELLAQISPKFNGNLNVSNRSLYGFDIWWETATANAAPLDFYEIYLDGVPVAIIDESVIPLEWQFSGLDIDTTYSVKVKIVDTDGNFDFSSTQQVSTVADTIRPSDVTNLVVTDYGAYHVSLGWTAATDNVGVTGYIIYDGDGNALQSIGGLFPSVFMGNLNLGENYSFKVKARDLAGNFSANYSNTVTQQTIDTAPPSQVIGITINSVSYDSVQVNWYPSTDDVGVVGYKFYNEDGSFFRQVLNVTTTVLTGLEYETPYTLKMKAIDAAGNESDEFSDSFSFTTLQFSFPPDVTNLQYTNLTYDTVRLTWDAPVVGEGQIKQDAFRIYTGDGSYLYGVNGGDAVFFDVNLPINGPEQTYKIKGYVFGGNESVNFSNTVSLTPPAFVYPTWNGVLTEVNATQNEVSFSWTPASIGTLPIDKYEIRRFNIDYDSVDSTSTSYTDGGLVADQPYRYKVRAVDTGTNPTDWSPELEIRTLKESPDWSSNPNLTLDEVTDSSIEVSWIAPYAGSTPIDYYEVYVNGSLVRTTSNTFANVTGLDASTQYNIFVKATNFDDLSADSNTLTASTLEPQVVDVITKISVGASSDCSYNGPWINAYWSKTGGTSQDLPPQGTALFTDATYTTPFNGDTDVKVMQNTASFLKQVAVVTEGGIVQPVSPC